jgi:lysophospholipase L1-like esterase
MYLKLRLPLLHSKPKTFRPQLARLGATSLWTTLWFLSIGHLSAQATAPTAVDDYLTLNENTQCCAIAVLANDSDPNNLTLSVTSVTQPSHGTSAIYAEDPKTVSYTPAANFTGTDTFTYTITNTAGGTASATVHVNVTPVQRLTILPLGDSITWGYNDGAITPTLGYRIPLLNELVAANIPIQYMGSDSTGSINGDAGASLNEGHVGYQIQQVQHNLNGNDTSTNNLGGYWLTGGNGTGRNAITPQVVLLHIGTNDATSGQESASTMLSYLQGLLTALHSQLPNAQIFVASLIPREDSTTAEALQEQYNAGIPSLLTSLGSNFHFVDMHTNFPANGITPSVDPLHPNPTGYAFMAGQWFSALSALYHPSSNATPVLTYHYDASADGLNSNETAITPANLTVNTFGKRYSTAVDGQIYAQPLYVPSVNVVGGSQSGTHNLVIVATQHDSLFAIDADSGAIVWQTSFLASGLANATTITSMPSADTSSTDTQPEIGICGTPVIDSSNMQYLYCCAKTKQILSTSTNPYYCYTIYKIDITNGNATANANIVASNIFAATMYNGNYNYRTAQSPTATQDPFVNGKGDGSINLGGTTTSPRVYFNAMRQMNRPGLVIYNGSVYAGFASHGDNGPYHGWLLGFDKNALGITSVFNFTPNLGLGGLWGAGASPAIDSNGYFYAMTGNGGFDGNNTGGTVTGLNSSGFPTNGDYGDCVVKLALDPTTSAGNQNINGWGMKVVDYFAPFNNQALNNADTDLGAGGCTLLPTSAGSSTHPNLLVASGKQGNVYLIDTANLGKFGATTDNVVQSQVAIGECFSTPAFFNGVLYYAGEPDFGKAFTISNATMSTSPVVTPDQFGWPGATPTISANGTNNGIVWMVDRNTAQLRAYYAASSSSNAAPNLATEIWTSATAANSRDALGTPAKFVTPTVADGHVFVGTTTALVEYGLTATATAPPTAPTTLTATAVSGLQINLTWADSAQDETGFAIEQSSDGVNFTQIGTVGVNVLNYSVISGLQPGDTYYFRVRAYNTYNTLSYSAYTNVANATTISVAPTLNFSSGFAGSTTLLQFNSIAQLVNNALQLTNGGASKTGTVWTKAVQNIQAFSTQFTFQVTSGNTGDGFTFAIQNNSPTIVGGYGGQLAYGGIPNSIAIKFDLYNNAGEGNNSTGLFVNGASPFTPATDLTASGINLHSGDIFLCSINYNGTTLSETITDTVTNATQTVNYTINIPSTIGSNTAYVGFTGATGGLTATQSILTWTFAPLPTTAPAAPTALTATAVSGTQINLAWTDNSTNESGFDIFRTNSSTGTFAQVSVVGPNVTTYSDTGLTPNTTYYYEVCATNNVGSSAYTNIASALVPVPPATPTNAQPTTITSSSIAMTWTDNSTNATGINILRKMTTASNFAQIATLAGNATTYTDTNLAAGTSYDYHIQAFNVAGYSDFSGFTAVTLSGSTPPVVNVSTNGAVAVNGLATGQFVLSLTSPTATALPISYTVSGTAVAGTDYTTLSGTATIPANASSVTIPVSALAGANPNSTVTITIASNAAYTLGSSTSATVVIVSPTFSISPQTDYGTTTVSGTTNQSVTLTFPGLTGNPPGAVYVWYLNGTAFATSVTGGYTITNAIPSQSGTYSVYAWAPGGVTGSATWAVTITNPPVVITTSVPSLTVNDGSTGTFTVSLASAPISNVTVNVSISGTPDLTVSPATITMTPTNYQNQTVAVSAAAINSNDSNRSAVVSLTGGTTNATVNVTDAISDTQTASNLTGTAYALTGANIGTGSAGDSSVHASGNWWIDGSGTGGLSGSADSFHFESQAYTGNFQMVVDLQNFVATGATQPLAGLMIRDGLNAGSNFLALAGTTTTTGGYSLISRTTVNTATSTTITSGANMTYTLPAAWMMLSRVGNVLHAFVSANGLNWYEVTNPSTGVTWTGMSSALDIGVFSSSGSTANARAVMNNFSISAGSSFTDADIGNPGVAGSASVSNGVYTVTGGGSDTWLTSDQFNYYSEPVSGNEAMIVQVNSIQNTSVWAKVGLMFRNSTAAGDQFVSVYENPGNLVEMQWRDTANANAAGTSQVAISGSATWLELVKVGTSYSAYYATTSGVPTAANWVLINTHASSFTNTNFLAGLAVCAHNNAVSCTTTFSNLSIQNLTTQAALTDLDIGNPGVAGLATGSGTAYTVFGGGADIWNASDQFNYLYQTNTTDVTITVHVDSIQNTNVWAKGGPMFRNSTAAGDQFVAIYENPGGYVEMQWRDAANNQANGGSQITSAATANWLKLVKSGSTFTGYYATTTGTPSASNWILIGTHSTTFTSTTGYLGGMAVTAHNNALVNQTAFSGYSQQ